MRALGRHEGKRRTAWMVCLCAVMWSASAFAQEGPSLEEDRVQAQYKERSAPRAKLRPLRGLATRYGVSISLSPPTMDVISLTDGTETTVFQARVENEHTIPLALCNAVVEYSVSSGSTLEFGGVRVVSDEGKSSLEPMQCQRIDPSSEGLINLVPSSSAKRIFQEDGDALRFISARFWVEVPEDSIPSLSDATAQDREGGEVVDRNALQHHVVRLHTARSVTLPEQLLLRRAEKRMGVEIDLEERSARKGKAFTAQYTEATQALCALEKSSILNVGIEQIAEREHLLRRFDNFAQHHPRFDGLSDCLTPDVVAHAATLAERIDAPAISAHMIERLEHTPGGVPHEYRSVVTSVLARRAQGYAESKEWALYLDVARKIQTFDPAHAILARRVEAFRAQRAQAIHFAKKYSFINAEYVMRLMDLSVQDATQINSPQAPLLKTVLAETRQEIAWERGRYQFHYRIHEEGMMEEADASFQEAMLHAPIGARIYRAGILFIEHQFKAIFFLVFLCLGCVVAVRSPWAWRWRQRRSLSVARGLSGRGKAHEARDTYWRVLSAVLGRSVENPLVERIKAHAASGILEEARRIGDMQEVSEAASYLRATDVSVRPQQWTSPAYALECLIGSALSSPIHVAKLESDAAVVSALFADTTHARAATYVARVSALSMRSASPRLWDELRECRAVLQLLHEDPTLEAHARDALHCILALAFARVGPASHTHAPLEAWQAVWSIWAQGACSSTGWALSRSKLSAWLCEHLHEEVYEELVHASWISGACAADVEDGVYHMQRLTHADMFRNAPQAVIAQCLLTLSRRAALPVASSAEESAEALHALSVLDDLLTDHTQGVSCLEARLKLAILRWIGGQATGQAARDTAYQEDCAALLRASRDASHHDTIRALAAILDVLTPGDWGFDAYAEGAQDGEQALFSLLRALDCMTRDASVEAISALVHIDPEKIINTDLKVRFLCARAVIAARLGQRDAALQALRKALDALPEDSLETQCAVDRVCARLHALLLDSASSPSGALRPESLPTELWASLARGALLLRAADSRYALPLSWATLGVVCARLDVWEVVDDILAVSRAAEADSQAQMLRNHAYALCASGALKRCDYTRARTYAILSENHRSPDFA